MLLHAKYCVDKVLGTQSRGRHTLCPRGIFHFEGSDKAEKNMSYKEKLALTDHLF
jgi:hypothetical protein